MTKLMAGIYLLPPRLPIRPSPSKPLVRSTSSLARNVDNAGGKVAPETNTLPCKLTKTLGLGLSAGTRVLVLVRYFAFCRMQLLIQLYQFVVTKEGKANKRRGELLKRQLSLLFLICLNHLLLICC